MSISRAARLLVAILLAGAALPASAQAPAGAAGPQTLQGFGLFGTADYWKQFKTGAPVFETGRWVRYGTEHPELNLGTVTVSVCPQKGLTEGKRRILEMKFVDATRDQSYLKMLFQGQPGDPKNVHALMMKAPGIPPIPLPVGAPPMAHKMGLKPMSLEAPGKAKVEYLGKEKVTVPAGTFQTWRYRVTAVGPDGEKQVMVLWLDATGKVPLYHLVQAKGDQGGLLMLQEMGEDARSDLPPFRPEDLGGGGQLAPPPAKGAKKTP